MKCQILFSGKNKKNNIILWSAENAQRVVKVKTPWGINQFHMILIFWLDLEAKTVFLINSAEHEIFSAHKYTNANNYIIIIFIRGETFMRSYV